MSAFVSDRYIDALGVERVVPEQTRAAFGALLDASAETALASPTVVAHAGAEVVVPVVVPSEAWREDAHWRLRREDGATAEGVLALRDAPVIAWRSSGGVTIDTRALHLPFRLPAGYHALALDLGAAGRAEVTLVAVPEACAPARGRTWGLAVQLYTLRSGRNWGIGDFGDLATIAATAADAGAAYVGLNPLHASHRTDPEAASPYAPSSRVWLNWLYLDVEAVEEAAHPRVRALLDAPAFAARLWALRATALVDYAGVAAAKDEALRLAHEALSPERRAAMTAWAAERGEPLLRFARFEALVARFGRALEGWPAAYRDAGSPEVAAFAREHADEVDYGIYLQWLADTRLAEIARDAAARGVRLYRDLAVGVESNGADAWAEPAAYVRDVSVGAPPDLLNTLGQDWGLPPADPRGLARDGYRAWAELVRANVRDAGALRIDHAMSLARLFWIPRGERATAGAYVRYPLDDLVGILALESERAGCVVIGEDLGTVPEGFRERMSAAEILSYRILFFERDERGAFVPPERYPERALAAAGTHDLAPLRAWLRADDVPLRARLGLVEEEAARAERAAERARLLEALVAAGDLDAGARDDEDAVVLAVHRFLARTPSAIAMVQLDDALGETAPVNVPGTSTEYPNWRRKLGTELERLGENGRFRQLVALMGTIRPR